MEVMGVHVDKMTTATGSGSDTTSDDVHMGGSYSGGGGSVYVNVEPSQESESIPLPNTNTNTNTMQDIPTTTNTTTNTTTKTNNNTATGNNATNGANNSTNNGGDMGVVEAMPTSETSDLDDMDEVGLGGTTTDNGNGNGNDNTGSGNGTSNGNIGCGGNINNNINNIDDNGTKESVDVIVDVESIYETPTTPTTSSTRIGMVPLVTPINNVKSIKSINTNLDLPMPATQLTPHHGVYSNTHDKHNTAELLAERKKTVFRQREVVKEWKEQLIVTGRSMNITPMHVKTKSNTPNTTNTNPNNPNMTNIHNRSSRSSNRSPADTPNTRVNYAKLAVNLPESHPHVKMSIFRSPSLHKQLPKKNTYQNHTCSWIPGNITGKYNERFSTTTDVANAKKFNAVLGDM